jgi:ribulose-5-phosphate 4-epimerase/fuculose-1-phosphate aldolase
MSQKISACEMIFCPTSSVPEEFEFSLLRMKLDFEPDDTADMRMHKLIYQHTHQNTCMITSNPVATAEGMAILAERFGTDILRGAGASVPYSPVDHPTVQPIDAEAIYLNPKLGLVDIRQLTDHTSKNPILNMLRWYKGCCVVAGYGVISTGQTTLEQAAHNASSAERIAQFRSEVFVNERLLRGPSVADFEPR